MTIDRTYRCDLCGDMRKPSDEMLIGLFWDSWPRQLLRRPASEVEHHICRECLRGLAKIAAEVSDTESDTFRTVSDRSLEKP